MAVPHRANDARLPLKKYANEILNLAFFATHALCYISGLVGSFVTAAFNYLSIRNNANSVCGF